MKTDRRHALQTNWLADHLGRWLDKIKPYKNHIVTGACVVVAGLAIWLVVARYWRGDEQAVWHELDGHISKVNRLITQETSSLTKKRKEKQDEIQKLPLPPKDDEQAQKVYEKRRQELRTQIGDLDKQLESKETEIREREQEELCRTAKEKIHTVAGRAAANYAANKDFNDAMATLLTDPIGAGNKLDRAADLFDLIRQNAKDTLLKQGAQFQLARVYETRLKQDDQHREKDDIQMARRLYEELASQVPPIYKADAERRLA